MSQLSLDTNDLDIITSCHNIISNLSFETNDVSSTTLSAIIIISQLSLDTIDVDPKQIVNLYGSNIIL